VLHIGTLVVGIALAGCSTYAPAPLGDGRGTTDLVHFTVPASSMPTRDLAVHRFDPSDGLDVTETAMLAVANNPDLKVKRDALGVAKAQAFAAGLLPDPQLSLSRDLPSGNGPAEPGIVTTSAFSLGLNYDIGALLTHSATLGAARSTREQVRLDLLWAEWQTIAQARLLFGQVLVTRAQEQRLTREVTALAPLDHQVQLALNAGNLTYDQASAGLDAVADVRRQLAESSRQRNQAEHDLRLLLGLAPQVPLDLIGAPYDSTTQPTQEQLEQALDVLPARRPDLLALKAGYAAQESTLRAAVIAQFPAINVGFTRARDNSDVYTNGFNIGITLPLFDRNRGNIAIEKATRQQLHDDYDARLLGTRSDMLQLQQDLTSFQIQIAALTEHAQQLDVASTAAERAWQTNLMDWPTYLSIRSNALSADLELVALQQEQAAQAIALETLLGGDWTDRTLSVSSPHHSISKQQP